MKLPNLSASTKFFIFFRKNYFIPTKVVLEITEKRFQSWVNNQPTRFKFAFSMITRLFSFFNLSLFSSCCYIKSKRFVSSTIENTFQLDKSAISMYLKQSPSFKNIGHSGSKFFFDSRPFLSRLTIILLITALSR